ncbi:MAG TPA: hypothetical protein VHO95_05515 [Candidatus Dormibacteraeota bacterium]|jgi:hypothetical protein|nr:hypothetical protein [Candidatus Dormibacteraeota bacterium]HEX2682224.1 hypothetical protein [Candidatus Dormibacteraeota bacterium]
MTVDEKFTVTRCELPGQTTPHRRFQIYESFDGAMKGRLVWTLEAQDIETDTSVDVEYELVGGIVGKAINALLLERINQKKFDRMLENMERVLARQTVSTR